jgi:uncharacterized protein YkwD
MRLLVSTAALLAVLSATIQTAPASSQDVLLERRVALEQAVVEELNRVRAARGIPTVRTTNGLRSAAVAHSRAMVLRGFFSHTSADGTAFHDRIRRHYTSRGWETWSVGETLFASSSAADAAAVVSAWLKSPPHREVILSSAWRDTGVAVIYRPSAPGTFAGADALVVTADFGLREGRVVRARATR